MRVLIGLLVFMTAALGCSTEKSSPASIPGPQSTSTRETEPKVRPVDPPTIPTKPSPPPAPLAPAIALTLSAEDVAAELKNRGTGAYSEAAGKTVQLSGAVSDVHLDANKDRVSVFLEPVGPIVGSFPSTARCEIHDLSLLGKLGKGQKIKLTGTVYRSLMGQGLVLQKCKVLDVGPPTVVTQAAEELAREYSGNSKAAEKYFGKTLVVTGEVTKFDWQPIRPWADVELKGDGKTVVAAQIHGLDATKPAIKVGDTVSFVSNQLLRYQGKILFETSFLTAK